MSETPAERLRRARLARGYQTAADAAHAYGWNVATYRSHENGTRGLRPDAAKTYARAFGVSWTELLGSKGSEPTTADRVAVVGRAALGVWRDIRLDMGQNAARSLPVTIPGTGGSAVRFAVEVQDASVFEFETGEFAIYRSLRPDEIESITLKSLLFVERRRGDLVEQTIRRVVERKGGTLVLGSYSRDNRLIDTITVPPPRDSGEVVEIKGKIVGRYIEMNDDT